MGRGLCKDRRPFEIGYEEALDYMFPLVLVKSHSEEISELLLTPS